MRWLFAATLPALGAALPTRVEALSEPVARELVNPFTGQRTTELTYHPDPGADCDDPPEEQPPAFPHAGEPRVGWSALYEAVTKDASPRHGDDDLLDLHSAATRLLHREALCGRPGAPLVCHVPEALRGGLLRLRSEEIPGLVDECLTIAAARVPGPPAEDWYRPHTAKSLREIACSRATGGASAGDLASSSGAIGAASAGGLSATCGQRRSHALYPRRDAAESDSPPRPIRWGPGPADTAFDCAPRARRPPSAPRAIARGAMAARELRGGCSASSSGRPRSERGGSMTGRKERMVPLYIPTSTLA